MTSDRSACGYAIDKRHRHDSVEPAKQVPGVCARTVKQPCLSLCALYLLARLVAHPLIMIFVNWHHILQGGCRYQGPYALCAPVVVEAIRFSVRVRAPVVRSVARRSEVLAAAIDVAGIQPLTSVPALVRLQVAQLREALATALVVACIWLLTRVRTFVRHVVG